MAAAGNLDELDGIVNLDKPLGWSSAKAVTAVRSGIGGGPQSRRAAIGDPRPDRRLLKIGHAGTLDPWAGGVLLLLVGRATCLAELLMDAGKEYVAAVRLGATSSTDDREGRIVPFRILDFGFRIEEEILEPESEILNKSEIRNPKSEIVHPPSREAIEQVLAGFIGDIQQRPPAFSAVKIAGKRAYALARRGRAVTPAMRAVRVDAVELLDYRWPDLRLRIVCGRGTYIRSLARDVGAALGVGGYLAGLTRTRVGPFGVEQAVSVDRCRADNLAGVANRDESRLGTPDWLLPMERAADHLPAGRRIRLDEKQTQLLARGTALDGRRIPDVAMLIEPKKPVNPLPLGEGRVRVGLGPADAPSPLPGVPNRDSSRLGAPLSQGERGNTFAAFDPGGRLIAICRLAGVALRSVHVLRPQYGPLTPARPSPSGPAQPGARGGSG